VYVEGKNRDGGIIQQTINDFMTDLEKKNNKKPLFATRHADF
jgi:hypothetical protein